MTVLILLLVFLISRSWKGLNSIGIFKHSSCICSVHKVVKVSWAKFRCHAIIHPLPDTVMGCNKDCLDLFKEQAEKIYLLEQVTLSCAQPQMLFSPPVSTLTVFLPQLWKWFGKVFALWASVSRFKHRKSLCHADDVTVKVSGRRCIVKDCLPTPTPHAHRAEHRGMWGQSLLIDHQRWNARYRKGKLNSHRSRGGLWACVSWISATHLATYQEKNNCQGFCKERNVEGFKEWGAVKSGVGSGGQRESSEQEIPPFIPPSFSSLFHALCLKFKFNVMVNGWMNGTDWSLRTVTVWQIYLHVIFIN